MRWQILESIRKLQVWLGYRYRMWVFKVSDKYIRTAFSALLELDIDEFRAIPGTQIQIKAMGNELHIKDALPLYECVIKEGAGRRIYVDEWRTNTRKVRMEYGTTHETHWFEVYRSGKWIRSARFVEYLKLLYGTGIQRSSHGIHVQEVCG